MSTNMTIASFSRSVNGRRLPASSYAQPELIAIPDASRSGTSSRRTAEAHFVIDKPLSIGRDDDALGFRPEVDIASLSFTNNSSEPCNRTRAEPCSRDSDLTGRNGIARPHAAGMHIVGSFDLNPDSRAGLVLIANIVGGLSAGSEQQD